MIKLILIRHGQSTWNKENKFTGWTDVELSKKGIKEAKHAAKLIKKNKYIFDVCYTSVLKRAIHTANIVLSELDQEWIPILRSWRLNERHYGALQGLNKTQTAKKYGEKTVLGWRRSFATAPPPLKRRDKRHPRFDPRYRNLEYDEIPSCESLKDTIERALPFWHDVIAKQLRMHQHVLIVSHGNSLRALIKHLDKISDKDILDLNVPTGIPLVYELNSKLKPIRHYYLSDKKTTQKAMKDYHDIH